MLQNLYYNFLRVFNFLLCFNVHLVILHFEMIDYSGEVKLEICLVEMFLE